MGILIVDFNKIEELIGKRAAEIQEIRRRMIDCITLDENLSVIVDPKRAEEAIGYIRQIRDLALWNDVDSKYIQKAKTVAAKYNLKIEKFNVRGTTRERLNFERMLQQLQDRIKNQEQKLKLARFNDRATPELEKEVAEVIEGVKKQIEIVKSAMAELEKVPRYWEEG